MRNRFNDPNIVKLRVSKNLMFALAFLIIFLIANIVWPQRLLAKVESGKIKKGQSYKVKQLLFAEDGSLIKSKSSTESANTDGYVVTKQELPSFQDSRAVYSSFCVISSDSNFTSEGNCDNDQGEEDSIVFDSCGKGFINITKPIGSFSRFVDSRKSFNEGNCDSMSTNIISAENGLKSHEHIDLKSESTESSSPSSTTESGEANQKLSLNGNILSLSNNGGQVDISSLRKAESAIVGTQGPVGPTGQDGANGLDGQDGSDGANGTNGINGVDGRDGADGAQGAQGIQGDPGLLVVDTGNGLSASLASQVLSLNLIASSDRGLANSSDGLGLIATCGNGQILKWNSSAWKCSDDVDTDTNTDAQTLSVSGSGASRTISILNGNTISVTDYDNQELSLDSNLLSLINGGQVDLSPYLDNTDSQALSWDGASRKLSLTSGGEVIIPDANTTYSAGDGLSLDSNNNFLVDAPTCSGADKLQWNGSGFNCANDVDTNTDQQQLSLNGNTLGLTDSTSLDLSKYLDNTDQQALGWDNSTRKLSLTSGGEVVIEDATSASNGLSLNGGSVELGGSLNKNTTISQGSYNLEFGGVTDSGRSNQLHLGNNVIGAGIEGVGFTSMDSGTLGYIFTGDATATGGTSNMSGIGLTDFTNSNAQYDAIDTGSGFASRVMSQNSNKYSETTWMNESIQFNTSDGTGWSNVSLNPNALYVNTNLNLNGELRPSGNAGSSGEILASGGSGATPYWASVGGLLREGSGIGISGNTISSLLGNSINSDELEDGSIKSIDLEDTTVTAGTYGSGTTVPVVTVNSKGQVTNVTTSNMPTASASSSGLLASTDWSTFNGKENVLSFTGNGLFTRSGDSVTALSCTSGQVVKWVGASFSCGSDADTDTDTGIVNINGLTGTTQNLSTGSDGTDFSITSSGTTHTFNLPDASTSARGLINTGEQTLAGSKTLQDNLTVNGASITFGDAATDVSTFNSAVKLNAGSCSSVVTNIFCQNGNSLGTGVVIGTNDAYGLSFETNNNVAATISATGELLLKDPSNSAMSFQVQNSSSLPMFSVDTIANRIVIGSTTSDANGISLALDSSTVEPTGVNGAMYYNSSMNKFRCYENGAWVNCVGSSSGGAAIASASFTIMAAPVTWTNAPAADTEFTGTYRILAGLGNYSQFRFVLNRPLGTVQPNANCRVQYSTTYGGTYTNLDGASGPEVTYSTAGVSFSSWANIATPAKTDVYLKVMCKGGNGVQDPQFRGLSVEVK
jgi:hypothetical protein